MDYSPSGNTGFNPQYDKSRLKDPYDKFADEDKVDDVENMSPEQLAQVDNFYVHDEVNKPYDPLVQPYSYFYVAISGQVEYGHFMGMDGLQVKYAFVVGDEWQLASGEAEGHGQYAFKGMQRQSGDKRIIWNRPFEVQYRSMSPHGWPRIVLYCLGKNSDGKEFVKAYGSTNVPIEPGVHQKTIRMYSPIKTGTIWEYFGWQFDTDGLSSLINNPAAVASPEGREVSRVWASGNVVVTMQVN